jgi:transposase-like protein
MGGDRFNCGEDWLHGGDAAWLGGQAERDRGLRAGLNGDERERIKALERENCELRQVNEILRKASAYFAIAEREPICVCRQMQMGAR